jgi:uncharacterized membrane protein YcaP (DUF421 family)
MKGLDDLLGLGLSGSSLTVLQMALRAIVVYVITVAIVRIGKKRFMGRATAFDVILGIMLGSIVSRAVTGNAPFWPALVAGLTLLLMHGLFSRIALDWHGFGNLIKGRSIVLIQEGKLDDAALRGAYMTERDLPGRGGPSGTERQSKRDQ